MELINETVARYRDWGYTYYIVNRDLLHLQGGHTVLPADSYVYCARIESRVVWIAQVPLGSATTEFLLHHGHCVVKPLPSILQR